MLSILTTWRSYYGTYMAPNMWIPIMSTITMIEGLSDSNHHSALTSVMYMDARKKFESVIRLIPGSYKNGDWKQLDGFFGMYFNETTMEVSEIPPPSL